MLPVVRPRFDPVFDAIVAVGAVVDRAIARRQAEDRGMFVARWPSLHPLDIFTPSIDFSYEAARRGFAAASTIATPGSCRLRASLSSSCCSSAARTASERLVQVRPQLDRAYIRGAWSRTSARTTSGSPYGMR
jgi:hypothetical protein